MGKKEDIFNFIVNRKTKMIELQKMLSSHPALAPESGGQGEKDKARALFKWLMSEGFSDIQVLNAPDERVQGAKRPNILVSLPGNSDKRTLWIMTHLDVVPPGESSLWENDPYEVIEKDGKLYGRGVEDNQQSLVASIFALLAFQKQDLAPAFNVKLLFVADEEVGSSKGIQFLLDEYDLFKKDDLILAPDGGNKDGTMIEIAEKKHLWLKFITKGQQCHAAMPGHGKNAFVAGSDLVVNLGRLNELFTEKNDLFDPPISTFIPTKKEANVPNINTVPGEDIFYLDSRILPSVSVDVVIEEIGKICKEIEKKHSVQIEIEVVQRMESEPTDPDADIVKLLTKAVKDIYKVDAKPVGIGGGTVAAYLRNKGLSCAVWSKIDETAHMPNEYSIIDNMIGDAKVMAHLMLNI